MTNSVNSTLPVVCVTRKNFGRHAQKFPESDFILYVLSVLLNHRKSLYLNNIRTQQQCFFLILLQDMYCRSSVLAFKHDACVVKRHDFQTLFLRSGRFQELRDGIYIMSPTSGAVVSACRVYRDFIGTDNQRR